MPFAKGQSGNPAGRPKGVPTSLSRYRQLASEYLPEVLEKLVTLAKAGNLQAAKILIDTVVPKPKAVPQAVPFDLDGGTLSESGRSIIRAASRGNLAPEQATAMLQALVSQAKLEELDAFEDRLRVLEAAASEPQGAYRC